MLEIVVCSLFVSSLGLQAVVLGSWMHWQQSVNAKQDEEEEEILTQYESNENAFVVQQANGSSKQQSQYPRLMGWEFKIVRSNRNLFRNPTALQCLCEEEAEAGWIMLEKLDDRRVRFKRPIAFRDIKSDFLNYDPYRCHYGSSWQPLNWLGAIVAMVVLVLPAYLGYILVSQTLTSTSQTPIPAAFPPLDQSPEP